MQIIFFVDFPIEKRNYFNSDGDMVVERKTLFRQVGWQINGGPNDGQFVKEDVTAADMEKLGAPHGSISPIYIEVGD